MSEQWGIQVSFKTPRGALVNLRADTPEQLDAELSVLQDRVARIAALESTLWAAATVGEAMPMAPAQPQTPAQPAPPAGGGWTQQGQTAQPPAPPAGGGWGGGAPAQPQQAGRLCKHNSAAKFVEAGVYKSGAKQGQPRKAFWACAFDKADQCDYFEWA